VKKYKLNNESISFLSAFLTASIILIVGLFFFTPQFQTNDDAVVNLAVSGALGGYPSEFLLYQHVFIGIFLKSLYLLAPNFPWYGILMYSYVYIGIVVTGYSIFRINYNFFVLWLWLLLLITYILSSVVSPQFTISASIISMSGIILLYSSLSRPFKGKSTTKIVIIIAAGLLVLGGMIRFQALQMVLVFMSVPLLFMIIFYCNFRTLRSFIIILLTVIIFSLWLQSLNCQYYSHSLGWEQFYSYNTARSDFIDRSKVIWNEQTQSVFKAVGWSQNDLHMLQQWLYLDPDIYSLKNLLFISQQMPELSEQRLTIEYLELVIKSLYEYLNSIYGFMLLLLILPALCNAPRQVQIIVLSSLAWGVAVFILISVTQRIPPLRVYLPILFMLSTLILLAGYQHSAYKGKPVLIVSLLLVILSINQFNSLKNISNENEKLQQNLAKDLLALKPKSDQLFVIWGATFPYEAFQLPLQTRPLSETMHIVGLGVGNHEPYVQDKLRSFAIKDLYQDFYKRDDIFIISSEYLNPFLAEYIREHYQVRVRFETVFKGNTFTVYQIRKD